MQEYWGLSLKGQKYLSHLVLTDDTSNSITKEREVALRESRLAAINFDKIEIFMRFSNANGKSSNCLSLVVEYNARMFIYGIKSASCSFSTFKLAHAFVDVTGSWCLCLVADVSQACLQRLQSPVNVVSLGIYHTDAHMTKAYIFRSNLLVQACRKYNSSFQEVREELWRSDAFR